MLCRKKYFLYTENTHLYNQDRIIASKNITVSDHSHHVLVLFEISSQNVIKLLVIYF